LFFGISTNREFLARGGVAGVVEDENIHDPRRASSAATTGARDARPADAPVIACLTVGARFASVIDNYRNMAGMLVNGEDLPRA